MADDSSAGYSWWSGAVNETWRRKGTDVYVVPTSSFVGIGTTAPETELEVEGTITADRVLGVNWPDILNKPVTEQTWIRNGADMYNANPGKIGVGTTQPAYKLHTQTGVRTTVSTETCAPLTKCYPPPGLSWAASVLPAGQTTFRTWKATTSVINTTLGSYPAATYHCWVNDYADGENTGNSTGRVHHVFEDKVNDYRPWKENDSDTNRFGGTQPPIKTYGTSIYFSSTEPFALKRYLIQVGSWALGAPSAWEVYGYPAYSEYANGYGPDGEGFPLSGGVKLHEIKKLWSTDYNDVQFGVYCQTMRADRAAFPFHWQTEEVFENGRVSRLYDVTNNTAFCTYEFRFLYVHNIAYRTYFDRDGLVAAPTSEFNNGPAKLYQKKTNEDGDVNKYGVSLSQIKMFAEQEVTGSVITVSDIANSVTDSDIFGYQIAQTRTLQNIYIPRRALHVLDASLFYGDATFYGTLCAQDVTFAGSKFVMSASSSFGIPTIVVPDEGFSFVAKFKPYAAGKFLTLISEYDHTRYFDNQFAWADDENNAGGVPSFLTFRGIPENNNNNWTGMPNDIFAKIPRLNAPTPLHFFRATIEGAGVLKIEHYLHDATALPKNGAQTESPYTLTCGIAFDEVNYLCVNVTAGNITVYLSDGSRFRKVAEMVTSLTGTFNKCPLKLATLGRSYRNRQKGEAADGCPMDLNAFYWVNGVTTSAERAIYHDLLKSSSETGINSAIQINDTLSLPLTTYDAERKEYTMEFNGTILGELSTAALAAEKVRIGQPDDALVFAPLHNEGRSYLKSAVGVGALPDPTVALNVGGNVQVAGSVTPTGAVSDLGTASLPFRELFLSGNTLHVGDVGVGKSGEGLALTYGAGNADLTLRALTAASVYATTYLNLPDTTWDDVTGKPSLFPSEWSIVSNKPSVFPSDWSIVANKPSVFPSEWSIVSNKPSVFPSEWSIVANKPELVLCEEDLRVQVPVASIVAHIGNEYINDPTFADIVGKTVNRDDYIELANSLGIPKFQTTFVVPTISAVNSDWNATSGLAQILNKPTIANSQWITNGTTINYTGNVGIGTTLPQKELDIIGGFQATSIAYDYNHVWTTKVPANDNWWIAVTWARELSLFVAVSTSGSVNSVMTSSDGNTWISKTATVSSWGSVTWSAELSLLVAVSGSEVSSAIMTSTDGNTWILRTAPSINQWTSVTWSSKLSIFVAVAQSGVGNRVMTSGDGITWISRTSVANNTWSSVVWSPELEIFVAVAFSGVGNRVMTSSNGITWISRTSAADNEWRCVAWSPELSMFVAVATTGVGNRVMTSTNGITWTIRTSAADNLWTSVVWASKLCLFVAVARAAVSGQIMTSPDGVNWTIRTSAAINSWYGVAWSEELLTFVAVAPGAVGNGVMTSSATNTTSKLQWDTGRLGLGRKPVVQLDLSTNDARKLTTTSWLTGSDERVKDNIVDADLDSCYNIAKNLGLKYFEWNSNVYPFIQDRHSVGFIAQEVKQYFPNAIMLTQENGYDDFHVLDVDQIYKVSYGALKKLIIDKELLEKRVESMESRLRSLCG